VRVRACVHFYTCMCASMCVLMSVCVQEYASRVRMLIFQAKEEAGVAIKHRIYSCMHELTY